MAAPPSTKEMHIKYTKSVRRNKSTSNMKAEPRLRY